MITFKQFLEDSKGSSDGLWGQIPMGSPTKKPSDGQGGNANHPDSKSGKDSGGMGGVPMGGQPPAMMKKMKKK